MPPRVVHVLYRLAMGGLENGVVNLINHMDAGRATQAVVALDGVTDFARRIKRAGVPVIALNKPPGHGVRVYRPLFSMLRQWGADIVHTHGLAALEMAPVARLAGCRVVHGEHGWDAFDPGGVRRKYRWLRRAYAPCVTHYTAVSQQIAHYLQHAVGVSAQRISCIANGVDTARFCPSVVRVPIEGSPFLPEHCVVGCVARLVEVKNPLGVVDAFARARQIMPSLRLVWVGDGPLWDEVRAAAAQRGLADTVWFPGARSDVAQVMRGLDIFVLGSKAEGMSNTLLEAMASGLPVVATDVGGNRELVEHGVTGLRVPPGEPDAMARAIAHYARDANAARCAGHAARQRVHSQFSQNNMVQAYEALYAQFG